MARVVTVNAKEIGGDYEPIPAGTRLKGIIYEVEEGKYGPTAKNAGKSKMTYTVKVTDDEYTGREIRYNQIPLEYIPQGMWNLTNFAKAVGWPAEKDESGEISVQIPDNLEDVLGTEVLITVKVEPSTKINPETQKPYNNNKVSKIEPLRKAEKQKGSGGGITDPWSD